MSNFFDLLIVGILIYCNFWYSFFSWALLPDKMPKEEFTIFGILERIIGIIIILLSFVPLSFGAIHGININKGEGLWDNLLSGMISPGIKIYLIVIPIQIVLLIIKRIPHFLHSKRVTQLQEHRAQKINQLKEQKVQKINESLDMLKSLNFKENLEKIALKYEMLNGELWHKMVPKTEMLPSTEQYNFMKNQMLDIKECIGNIILNSEISRNPDFISIIKSEENSVEDKINATLKELVETTKFPECINKTFNYKNSDIFYEPLNNFCNAMGIDINQNNFSLIRKKEAEYIHIFKVFLDDFHNEYAIARKGALGEQKVSEHLELYNDVLTNLENIRFGVEDTTVEADNIVICDKGVFCIETKNYGKEGETIEVTKDGQWRRYDAKYEKEMPNVSEQHNRHIGIMQRTVNQELKNRSIDIPYVFFEPIYVIANDDVTIKNQSDDIVLIRTSSIYPYINRFEQKNILSKDVQALIRDIILEHKQELKKYPIHDYRECIIKTFESLVNDIEKSQIFLSVYEEYIHYIEKLYSINTIEIEKQTYIAINYN